MCRSIGTRLRINRLGWQRSARRRETGERNGDKDYGRYGTSASGAGVRGDACDSPGISGVRDGEVAGCEEDGELVLSYLSNRQPRWVRGRSMPWRALPFSEMRGDSVDSKIWLEFTKLVCSGWLY